MYQIDKDQNRIKPLSVKRFCDLGFCEREHLQEWLANEPMALGEELLIIQKEFDGFDDTRERLDLLALDKDANLVIIENKLDDSGRDVIWQALKYASYCSSLSKAQVIEVYQQYLNRCCSAGDAQALLCEFLEVQDLDETVLNAGNKQRVMLVAANFRKEVTSTALWLLSHNIRMQCFRVTPYSLGESLFLNVEQIIPTPEAEEFMIGISAKEAEQKADEKVLKSRQQFRREYWERALEALRESETTLFNNVSPGKDHWLAAGGGVAGCIFQLIFGSSLMRIELCIARSSREENKFLFDQLYEQREKIETEFGGTLSWERLDDKKGSYVRYGKQINGDDRDNWPEMIQWQVEYIIRLEKALKQPLLGAGQALRQVDLSVEVPPSSENNLLG